MRPTSEEPMAQWIAVSRRSGLRRRNWRVVRRLAALTVVLLLAGLVAELAFASRVLAITCWVTAGAAGAAMLVWFRSRRLFID